MFLAPFLLERSLALTVPMAGLWLALSPAIIGVGSPLFGALSDRLGHRTLNLVGPLLMAVGAISLACLPTELTTAAYAWRVGLLALGLAIFNAPNNALIMGCVQKTERPTASALLSFALLLGQAFGVWAAATLFHGLTAWLTPGATLSLLSGPQISANIAATFWALALMPLAILTWNFLLPRAQPPDRKRVEL